MDIDTAIRKTALRENKSEAEIIAAMQETIDAAYSDPDPSVRQRLDSIPRKGERITPQELLRFVGRL